MADHQRLWNETGRIKSMHCLIKLRRLCWVARADGYGVKAE